MYCYLNTKQYFVKRRFRRQLCFLKITCHEAFPYCFSTPLNKSYCPMVLHRCTDQPNNVFRAEFIDVFQDNSRPLVYSDYLWYCVLKRVVFHKILNYISHCSGSNLNHWKTTKTIYENKYILICTPNRR